MGSREMGDSTDAERLRTFGALLTRYFSNPTSLLADMGLKVQDDNVSKIIQKCLERTLTHAQFTPFLTASEMDTTQVFISKQSLLKTAKREAAAMVTQTYNKLVDVFNSVSSSVSDEERTKQMKASSNWSRMASGAAMALSGLGQTGIDTTKFLNT
jgi:hypothetical protein